MEAAVAPPGMVAGSAELRRVGRIRFPVEEFVGEEGLIAHLGRDGSLRVFFGPGRRVRLADGAEWRIKATTAGRHIVPIIRSNVGTIAISGPLYARRSYGINSQDEGITLIPLGRVGLRRPALWALRRHETRIATIDDRKQSINAIEPISIAAALLAFTLVTHGIPGEGNIMPTG